MKRLVTTAGLTAFLLLSGYIQPMHWLRCGAMAIRRAPPAHASLMDAAMEFGTSAFVRAVVQLDATGLAMR